MARPKGSKNRRTVLREAEKAMSKSEEFVDSMHVLEYTMRHFYTRALLLTQINGKPEQIDANLKEAAAIAEMIVPYRHPRLKAITLTGDPNSPLRIRMMPVLTKYGRKS
jgi:acetolactate synthase small subunit